MVSFQLNPATLCKRFSLLLLLLPVIIVWRCYLLFSIWLTQGGVYGVLMKPGATFRTDDAKKLTRCGFAHLHIACYVSALVLTKVNTLNKLKVTYTNSLLTRIWFTQISLTRLFKRFILTSTMKFSLSRNIKLWLLLTCFTQNSISTFSPRTKVALTKELGYL